MDNKLGECRFASLRHKWPLAIAGMVLAVLVGTGLQDASGQTAPEGAVVSQHGVVKTISLPTNNASLVVTDPVINRLYVDDNNTGRLQIINTETNRRIGKLYGEVDDQCCGHTGLATNPLTHRLYAAGIDTGETAVVDEVSRRVLSRVLFTGNFSGDPPGQLAVNPATSKVYVTSAAGEPVVEVINGHTNRVVRTLHFGSGGVSGVAADPVANRVYLGVGESLSRQFVYVLNGDTDQVMTRVRVSGVGFSLATDPVLHAVYFVDSDHSVAVIDGRTNRVTTSVRVGSAPADIATDPIRHLVYVINSADETVSIIDGRTNRVVATMSVTSPRGIATDPLEGTAYVSNGLAASVTVIR